MNYVVDNIIIDFKQCHNVAIYTYENWFYFFVIPTVYPRDIVPLGLGLGVKR